MNRSPCPNKGVIPFIEQGPIEELDIKNSSEDMNEDEYLLSTNDKELLVVWQILQSKPKKEQ